MHKSGYFGAFRAFWKCLHLPATKAKLREGNHFDDNLKSSVVIQVVAAIHVELLQLQLLKAFGDCEGSELSLGGLRGTYLPGGWPYSTQTGQSWQT